jgi:hypothetical protein
MVEETTKQSSISIGFACSVVHDNIDFREVVSGWYVRNWGTSMCTCAQMFVLTTWLYHDEDDNCLLWLVIDDEAYN